MIQEDIDRISDELEMAYKRYPVLESVGVKTWVNGAFTFSPDGNPLVGPVRGLPNYWLACGVMAGFLQGGGVGKTLAEWMISGETEADAWPMDNARYGSFTSNTEYIRQTTGQFYARRFVMTYPNEQLWAGRPLKTAPAYTKMNENGALWGESWGLEIPLLFAPKSFKENPTLKRSNAFELVGRECKAARETAAILDITGFSRFRVSGESARSWLDRLLAGRLPAENRVRLCPMLAPSGRLRGDLTVLNWGDGTFWIMGSYYLRAWHKRWFEDHLENGVEVADISDAIAGFSVSGPKSREILASLARDDISNDAMPFMSAKYMDIGLVRASVARLSVTGELGYEINCEASHHQQLYDMLLDAGRRYEAAEIGYYALNSLRLEKSFGIWNAEFMQAYTPGMTGLDRWIDWRKKGFIGRESALGEERTGSSETLVTLEIDAVDADASGYEPVWHQGKRVGFVTSGGYGHTVGKSLAMSFVPASLAKVGAEFACHIVGEERGARIIANSPYDPKGVRMRA
ncbi:MAG: FAD-dependent oxidoreductase [Albidovulum sp.]|nr:FAD-dependent oxidoreductase [Albidovulum sp.]